MLDKECEGLDDKGVDGEADELSDDFWVFLNFDTFF